MPEVVEDGVTGYIVDSVEEAICKIGGVLALDRGRIRRRFEQRFTADRMAQDYVKVYAKLIGSRAPSRCDRSRQIIVANGSAEGIHEPRGTPVIPEVAQNTISVGHLPRRERQG